MDPTTETTGNLRFRQNREKFRKKIENLDQDVRLSIQIGKQGLTLGLPVNKSNKAPYGAVIIAGIPGSGKSVIAKTWVVEAYHDTSFICSSATIGYEEHLIIIDNVDGEWWPCITRINHEPSTTGHVKHIPPHAITLIRDPQVRISDLDRKDYWEMLGFPNDQLASIFITRLAPAVTLHQDDPDEFSAMLDYMNRDWTGFVKYAGPTLGLVPGERWHEATLDSMTRYFANMKDQLHDPKSSEGFFITDWAQTCMKKRVTLFEFPVKRAMGKVLLLKLLRGIENEKTLDKLHPIMIVEEADRLLSDPVADPQRINHASALAGFAITKWRKFGFAMFCILQNPSKLNKDILTNSRIRISGLLFDAKDQAVIMPAGREFPALVTDIDRGVYNFTFVNLGNDKVENFFPITCPCRPYAEGA